MVQAIADGEGVEVPADRLWGQFRANISMATAATASSRTRERRPQHEQDVIAKVTVDGNLKTILGHGNGPVDGFVNAIRKESGLQFDVADYREHTLGMGSNASAIAYVELRLADGSSLFGSASTRTLWCLAQGGALGREPGAEAGVVRGLPSAPARVKVEWGP